MKKLFTCGFHVYLSLEIFPYEAFVYKFKTQFLSKWWISGLVISRTTENIAIIFSVTQIHIKTITFEKSHCCGDAPVNGLRQFFCHYFYSCFSYFSTFSFLFMVLISFVVNIYICRLICVDCMIIFSQYTLNERQEKSHEKKFVQFFQNAVVYWLFKLFSAMRRCATVLCATCMALSLYNNLYVKDVRIEKAKSG